MLVLPCSMMAMVPVRVLFCSALIGEVYAGFAAGLSRSVSTRSLFSVARSTRVL